MSDLSKRCDVAAAAWRLHDPATNQIAGDLALGLFGGVRPDEVQSIKALRRQENARI
jgi:hypothetical protein